MVKAFLANEGFFFFYSNPTCIYRYLNMFDFKSMVIRNHANSSSSHNRRPVLVELSMKGFRTQSYSSVFSDGK